MTSLLRLLVPLVRPAAFIALSFLIVGVVYAVTGFSVTDVALGVWQGAVGAPGAIEATLRWGVPLAIIGTGVAIAVRAGFFNVGAQGQFYVGATGALIVALALPDAPEVLVVPLATIVAMLAGAAWALAPGLLRVRAGTDEVITTLMGNFLAGLWLIYLTSGPLQDQAGSGESHASRVVTQAFRISDSSGVSPLTLGIAAIVVVLVWVLLTRTSFGLASALAGRNPVMARWQGIDVDRIGILAFAASGGLAGLAGAVELFGPAGRLVSGFAPDLGFSAILVAIVGNLSAWGIAAAALFFGGLQASILYLPIVTDLPRSALDLLRGTIALLITVGSLSFAFGIRRHLVRLPVLRRAG